MKLKPLLLLMSLSSLLFAFAKGDPLKVGDAAPAVTGITEAGTSLNFGDVYKQHTYTLVYFYPRAGTSGCTAQGCSLRDGYDVLTKKGVAVLGVSTDDVAAQKKFKDEQHFPFTLIADAAKTVISAFGVPTKNIPAIGEIAIRHRLTGPNLCFVGGNGDVLAEATDLIRRGEADGCVCVFCAVVSPAVAELISAESSARACAVFLPPVRPRSEPCRLARAHCSFFSVCAWRRAKDRRGLRSPL